MINHRMEQFMTAGATQPTGTVVKMLSVQLGSDVYAIDIADVAEVVILPSLTTVPFVPAFIKGVTNLRGRIITVVDIGHFLYPGHRAGAVGTIGPEARIMVVDSDGDLVGVVFDKVWGAVNVTVEKIQPPLAAFKTETDRYVKGQIRINDRVHVLLDIKSLLRNQEMTRLSSSP